MPLLRRQRPRAWAHRIPSARLLDPAGTICNGWQAADFDQLTKQIESAAAWTKEAGFKLEQFAEIDRMRVRRMIERQVLLGVEGGHFTDVGILPDDLEAIRAQLEKAERDSNLFAKGRPIL